MIWQYEIIHSSQTYSGREPPQPRRTISEELNHNNQIIEQRTINKSLRNKIKKKEITSLNIRKNIF